MCGSCTPALTTGGATSDAPRRAAGQAAPASVVAVCSTAASAPL